MAPALSERFAGSVLVTATPPTDEGTQLAVTVSEHSAPDPPQLGLKFWPERAMNEKFVSQFPSTCDSHPCVSHFLPGPNGMSYTVLKLKTCGMLNASGPFESCGAK